MSGVLDIVLAGKEFARSRQIFWRTSPAQFLARTFPLFDWRFLTNLAGRTCLDLAGTMNTLWIWREAKISMINITHPHHHSISMPHTMTLHELSHPQALTSVLSTHPHSLILLQRCLVRLAQGIEASAGGTRGVVQRGRRPPVPIRTSMSLVWHYLPTCPW